MSAAALMDWLGEHMPEVQKKARGFLSRTFFHAYMGQVSGVVFTEVLPWDDHDELCAIHLAALKAKHAAASPTPRKPAPQIPPPVWDTRKVTADGAWAAVVAMCGGK